MGFQAWVNSLSGLPSFRLTGGGVLRAGDRVVAEDVSGFMECCDPLAPVGVPVDYSFAGQGATLTRLFPYGEGAGEHKAIVCDLTGRRVVVDFYEDTGDAQVFRQSVIESPGGGVYFVGPGARQGRSRFVMDGPKKMGILREVLEGYGVILISLGGPAAGVEPVMCVRVDRVTYRRTTTDGAFEIDVEWTECPFPQMVTPVPAVSWGDAILGGFTWGHLFSSSSVADRWRA